jgi:hypothetical protein
MRVMLRASFIAVTACLLLGTPTLWAQGGSPMLTEDTGTPGNNKWELDLTFQMESRRGEKAYQMPLLDLNYGIGDRVQLELQLPWILVTEDGHEVRSGLGNSLASVKWRFLDQGEGRWKVSTRPEIEFNNPTSSARRGVAAKGTGFLFPIEVDRKAGPVTLGAEVGYAVRSNGEQGGVYGLVIGFEPVKKLELLAEVHGTLARDFREHDLIADLAFRWKFCPKVSLMGLAGHALLEPHLGAPRFLGLVGLQFRF